MRSVVALSVAIAVASCSSSGSDGNGNGGNAGSGGTTGTGAGGDGSPTDAPSLDGGFNEFQIRNLNDVNTYRATLGIAPLKLDAQLSAFAYAGSQEESQNHIPHDHFMMAEAAGTLFTTDGFSMSAGENQGDPTGWSIITSNPTTNELDQIDAIQKAMFDEGPGDGEAHGHYENIMNPAYDRLGVGLLSVGNKLYLTNDFSAD
jgi:uncharacterized protein YkwD